VCGSPSLDLGISKAGPMSPPLKYVFSAYYEATIVPGAKNNISKTTVISGRRESGNEQTIYAFKLRKILGRNQ